MPSVFYLAYGEGQLGSTATGIFSALVVVVACCIAFVLYAYKTYPVDQD